MAEHHPGLVAVMAAARVKHPCSIWALAWSFTAGTLGLIAAMIVVGVWIVTAAIREGGRHE